MKFLRTAAHGFPEEETEDWQGEKERELRDGTATQPEWQARGREWWTRRLDKVNFLSSEAIDLMKDAPRTAIMEASYPGSRGAEALADVIFGRSVPSGKLAATVWSKSFQNLTGVDESNLTWACSPTAIHSDWQWNPAVRSGDGSDGLTHMFFQGDDSKILWKFGFGLR